MFKLERLILAMAEAEGWQSPVHDPAQKGSQSWRNKNPLNLRTSPFEIGNADGFSVFNTDADGFAAARWDILQKSKGNTVTNLTGESTIKELLWIWAPESDRNNPAVYATKICYMSGLLPQTKLKELLDW